MRVQYGEAPRTMWGVQRDVTGEENKSNHVSIPHSLLMRNQESCALVL